MQAGASEEMSLKISIAQKGKKKTNEHRTKISIAHKGKTHSFKTKKNMSEAQKRQYAIRQSNMEFPSEPVNIRRMTLINPHRKEVVCIETNIVYPSACDAARHCKTSDGSILRNCKGKSYSAGGFHWCFLHDYSLFKAL